MPRMDKQGLEAEAETTVNMPSVCAFTWLVVPPDYACPICPVRGWRLSLAGAAESALLLILGSLLP